jgi:hypothetical protein
MRKGTLIAGAIVLGACSPAESNGPTAKPEDRAEGDVAPPAGSPQPRIDRGTYMLPIEVLITSDRGQVSAELASSEASRALAEMLPLRIAMRDHLRQEKTGHLPSPLPDGERQTNFSAGTLGLWGDRDLVIYHRSGRVPAPGIIILGQVRGDVSLFDNPDPVTITFLRAN